MNKSFLVLFFKKEHLFFHRDVAIEVRPGLTAPAPAEHHEALNLLSGAEAARPESLDGVFVMTPLFQHGSTPGRFVLGGVPVVGKLCAEAKLN